MANISKSFEIQHGLVIDNIATIIAGDNNPAISGEVAPVGTLYISSNGEIYSKTGSGDTDWATTQTSQTTLKTTNATLLVGESGYIHADASGGSIILTLPLALSAIDRIFHIMKIDDSQNGVTIIGNGGETIGPSGVSSILIKQKGVWFALRSNGVSWNIIGEHPYPDPRVIKVSKVGADFTSIKSAIDTITDSSNENYYVVRVGPGDYTEPEINVPPYVNIIGESIHATHVIPDGNHNVFNLNGRCEISQMTIHTVPTGYCGVSAVDTSNDLSIITDVWFEDVDTAIKIGATTAPTSVRMRNIRVGGTYSRGFDVEAAGAAALYVSISSVAFSPNGPSTTEAVKISGSNATLIMDTARIYGSGVGTGILLTNGADVSISDTHLTGWSTAIKSDNVGSNANLTLSSIIFANNTMNVVVDNATTTGFFAGGYSEYSKYSIHPSSAFFFTNKDSHVIIVAKAGGDFTSVKSAVDSITTASITNPYHISIGPGIFEEDTITLKPYVNIIGRSPFTTQIKAANPNNDIIVGIENSSVELVTLTGATGTGARAVYYTGSDANPTTFFLARDIMFGNNDIQIKVDSDGTNASTMILDRAGFGDGFNFTTGIVVESVTGGAASVSVGNIYLMPTADPHPTTFLSVNGPGAEATLMSSKLKSDVDSPTGTAIYIANGGTLHSSSNTIMGFAKGLHVANVGSAPAIHVGSVLFDVNAQDIHVEHPNTTGCIVGVADKTKVVVDDNAQISITYVDTATNGTVVAGNVFMGSKHSKITNVAQLLLHGATMGLYEGGEITLSAGLTINVAAGSGYVQDTSDVDSIQVIWGSQQLVLPANSDNYVYFNSAGSLLYSGSLPDVIRNVILGRVVTNAGNVIFVDSTPYLAHHASNYLNRFNREALGAIYVSGSVVTENAITSRAIDVSSGQYYVSQNRKSPTGGAAVGFESFYHSLGNWIHASQTLVSNTQYDNGTDLTSITAGYYAKHALYIVGDGSLEKYLFVYSQSQWSTIEAARLGDLPAPPSSFRQGVVLIAGIIVQEGTANIVEIQDNRPFPSYKAGGTTSVTNHGDLLNLLNDDHPQYLLVDGTRAMTGALNMGTQNITNVGTVDGVDVSAHASRHLPNGLDPLATAAPTTGLTTLTLNTEGTANSFARSDHTHAITGVQAASVELTGISNLTLTGLVTRTAAGTYETRSISVPAEGISITNANGVAGDPTLALADDLAALEGLTTQGLSVRTGISTWTTRSIVAPAAGITISNGTGVVGNPTLALANDLAAVEGLTGDGFAVRTTTDTWENRTLVPPVAGITITNPAGIAGNPTFILANDLGAIEALNSNGILTRTGTDAWSARSIDGTTAQITVQNGSGVGGNPTVGIATNPILPGTEFVTVPLGTTAQRPTVPTVGMLRVNTTDQVLEGYINPYSSLTSPTPSLFQKSIVNRKRRALVDDFMFGGTGINLDYQYGDLGWSSISTGGGSSLTRVSSALDHPGIIALTAGNAIGRRISLHMSPSFTDSCIVANQVSYMCWIVRIPDITTMQVTIGMGTDLSTSTFGTNAVYFEFNPTLSPNWRFVSTATSVSSVTTTALTVTPNVWYLLEMFYDGTGWTPVINEVSYAKITTNIPVVGVNVGVGVQSNTGTQRTMQVDYFSMITREMGSRY